MLEQHRGNVARIPKRRSKDRNETLPSLCSISLDTVRVVDDVNLLQKCFQRKGASRCMIIKLVNIHAIAQYL